MTQKKIMSILFSVYAWSVINIPFVFAQTVPSGVVKLENPLRSELDSIPAFLNALLNIVVKIGIPIVTLFIIYTGFLFVKARGNEQELSDAKKSLVWTLIGAAIVLGATVLAGAIEGTIKDIQG